MKLTQLLDDAKTGWVLAALGWASASFAHIVRYGVDVWLSIPVLLAMVCLITRLTLSWKWRGLKEKA